jgi:hypothetical protein
VKGRVREEGKREEEEREKEGGKERGGAKVGEKGVGDREGEGAIGKERKDSMGMLGEGKSPNEGSRCEGRRG